MLRISFSNTWLFNSSIQISLKRPDSKYQALDFHTRNVDVVRILSLTKETRCTIFSDLHLKHGRQ